eukprot:363596-Chlamydomonas_euryale.AAC.9
MHACARGSLHAGALRVQSVGGSYAAARGHVCPVREPAAHATANKLPSSSTIISFKKFKVEITYVEHRQARFNHPGSMSSL